jgi:hypothetical protein
MSLETMAGLADETEASPPAARGGAATAPNFPHFNGRYLRGPENKLFN